MARRRWFYSRRGTQHGPFKGREITAMVEGGEILGSDLLWKKGGRPRPAARYRKLFQRRPTVRTRNWILLTACISSAALLLALLLSPGSEWTQMAPEHLRGFCIMASIAFTLIAVAALGICAIALDTTFVDTPVVTVRQPHRRPDRRPEPVAAPRKVGADASPWATPQALSWGIDAAQAFATRPSFRGHRPRWNAFDRRTIAAVAVGLAGAAIGFAGLSRGPFRYHPVSGTVAYADGSLMPITEFELVFHPLARPQGAATRPPPGTARVDGATGTFAEATTASGGSGIVAGRHKVTLHAADGTPLPEHLVDRAYSDPSSTLLQIDTAVQPVSLRLEKP
jgi:hypothetical protein